MKRLSKPLWISALILIVLGVVLAFFAMRSVDFEFSRIGVMQFSETKTEISECFSEIILSTLDANVYILPTEDEVCTVVSYDSDKISHAVSVKDGFLTVRLTDTRKWYERIGISFSETNDVTVYLPRYYYYRLAVATAGGNVTVDKGFSFKRVDISTVTGEISFSSAVTEEYYARSVSGAQEITEDAEVDCRSVMMRSVGGTLTLCGVRVSEHLASETASGNIVMQSVSGAYIMAKTVTGNITGTVADEMCFSVSETDGTVQLPPSKENGARFEIHTTQGSVDLSYVDPSAERPE